MSSPSSYYLFPRIFFLFLCSRFIFIDAKPARCHKSDMSALLQFKGSFTLDEFSEDPLAYPKTESWTSTDCCLWDGIECDRKSGRVVSLDLSSSFLYGSINSSSSLFKLVHLQRINLAYNNFNDSRIPVSIGLFPSLTHLNLSSSYFSGPVPQEISKLTGLVSLDLGGPSGSLQIPDACFSSLIKNLTLLEELVLAYVNISSSIPESFANLSSLRALSLAQAKLHGEFPDRVFQQPKLEIVDLSFNRLTGHLPEFNSTSPLQILQLPGTRFSGQLPDSLGNLRSLNKLDLNTDGCNFSGSIPDSVGNLWSLTYLDLSNCKFSGSIPSSFGNLSQLSYLDMTVNKFTARRLDSMPWLWKLTKLTNLNLQGINLQGEIPPLIGNLTKLVDLGLDRNQLEGEIPSPIMNLTSLVELHLMRNQLSGHIPNWLMNMTRLTLLDLSTNKFKGPVPSTISQLRNLRVLKLHENNFTGTLELDTFIPLINLYTLHLSMNKLSVVARSGTSSGLPPLRVLGLASCNLTEFPNILKDQEVLDWLDLSFNKISGEIPSWVSSMSLDSLEFLNLENNSLTRFGHRPDVVLPWKNLFTLDLTSNLFEGSVPIPPPSIKSYLIGNNKFTGEFLDSLCSLSSLVTLDLSNNLLGGELPRCLGNISVSLSILNLQRNRFRGHVPQFHTMGKQLRMISLAENHFGGKLPRSLAGCIELQFVNFGNNQFNDTFPSWLDTLPELRVVILRSNNFHGSIGRPSSATAFRKLRIIDLSHNSFSGTLPRYYIQCWNDMEVVFDASNGKASYMNQSLVTTLYVAFTYSKKYEYQMTIVNKGLELSYLKILDAFTAVDLSGNMFDGEIPDVIGELKGLHLLNLSSNLLTGRIPNSLGNLMAIESLDLSQNRLSGEIPQELTRLNFLSVFDVSHNDLTGPIPKGKQFDTFQKSAFEGNEGLCGDVISRRCGGVDTEPTGKNRASEEEEGRIHGSSLAGELV